MLPILASVAALAVAASPFAALPLAPDRIEALDGNVTLRLPAKAERSRADPRLFEVTLNDVTALVSLSETYQRAAATFEDDAKRSVARHRPELKGHTQRAVVDAPGFRAVLRETDGYKPDHHRG